MLKIGIISVAAALSVPVFIWIANRMFYNSLKYVDLGQSPASMSSFWKSAKVVPIEESRSKTAPAQKTNSIIKSFPAPISPSATSKHMLPVFYS